MSRRSRRKFAPFSEPELRDVERRAREQLAFHDKTEANPRCARCCNLAEILRLVATVRACESALAVGWGGVDSGGVAPAAEKL